MTRSDMTAWSISMHVRASSLSLSAVTTCPSCCWFQRLNTSIRTTLSADRAAAVHFKRGLAARRYQTYERPVDGDPTRVESPSRLLQVCALGLDFPKPCVRRGLEVGSGPGRARLCLVVRATRSDIHCPTCMAIVDRSVGTCYSRVGSGVVELCMSSSVCPLPRLSTLFQGCRLRRRFQFLQHVRITIIYRWTIHDDICGILPQVPTASQNAICDRDGVIQTSIYHKCGQYW